MRAVVQKVKSAKVSVSNEVVGQIEEGFVVLLAVKETDTDDDLAYIKRKIENLRIFEDEDEKMNLSINDVEGEILLVSQFTLYGDVRKGNRPSFVESAKADKANSYYERLTKELLADGYKVATGRFQTHMQVELINDGPVTILLDSERIV